MARYVAITYCTDNRPEKKANEKKPKGGWRTTSGVRKLGKRAIIDASSFGEAAQKASELVAALKPATQKQIVRVAISLEKGSPEAGGNPFEE